MLLQFTKMHGLGNDFVLLDLISQTLTLHPHQIRMLGDRRLGIGFDQMLVVEAPTRPDADFRYRIYNKDGTEAQQCGNGARCFFSFVRACGLTIKTHLVLETGSSTIECKLEKDQAITVNQGAPIFQPQKIPFVAEHDNQPQVLYRLDATIESCGKTQQFMLSVLSMGNPHAILVVDDVETTAVAKIGAVIGQHPRFPEGVNVGFMQILGRKHIKLRVFERGAGETRACGTGACAAIVAARLQGLVDETVKVSLPGGDLSLTWQEDAAPVMMTGPASRVYEGCLYL